MATSSMSSSRDVFLTGSRISVAPAVEDAPSLFLKVTHHQQAIVENKNVTCG